MPVPEDDAGRGTAVQPEPVDGRAMGMPVNHGVDAVFPHDYRFDGGYLYCGEAPGHGVDIDEEQAAQYPYKRAYLPVTRLADGSLFNW